jgi:hypothetical protein
VQVDHPTLIAGFICSLRLTHPSSRKQLSFGQKHGWHLLLTIEPPQKGHIYSNGLMRMKCENKAYFKIIKESSVKFCYLKLLFRL